MPSAPSSLGGRPDPSTPVPAAVLGIAGGDPVRPVWRNELGGLTFAIGTDRFVKWQPAGAAEDPAPPRLRWAIQYTPVPRVLAEGADADGRWLVTEAIDAPSAVDERWIAEPHVAVRAIGRGLRAMHDALPLDDCPFSWSVADRLAQAGAADRLELGAAPPIDRLVVCHGDACAPNTLISDDGEWCAHVDLGALGVADRWADLAIATWSSQWNYGPGFEDELLDAYGVSPDPERTDYYRQLWDLTP